MGTSTTTRRWRRITAITVAGVLAVGAAAVISYRVLAPAEVSTPARAAYKPVRHHRSGRPGHALGRRR